MKIIWYVSDLHACGLVRADVPARGLNDLPDVAVVCKQGRMPSDLVGTDAIVMQRGHRETDLATMQLAKSRGIRVVYDLDDDLFRVPQYTGPAGAYFAQPEVRQCVALCLNTADVITVSSEVLAARVREVLTQDTPIVVIPNCVDLGQADLSPGTREDVDSVVIGWHASLAHSIDAMLVAPALRLMLDARPEVKVRIVGPLARDSFGGLLDDDPARVQFVDWAQPEALYGTLADFDIGICPLRRDSFADAKSDIKFLEYSAARVPCVVSKNVPAYDPGLPALFAGPFDKDWVEQLSKLVEDPALRETQAQTAYDWVKAHRTPAALAPDWKAVILGG